MWKSIGGMLFNLAFKRIMIGLLVVAGMGAAFGLYRIVNTYTNSKANEVVIAQQKTVIVEQTKRAEQVSQGKVAENAVIETHVAVVKEIKKQTIQVIRTTDIAVVKVREDPVLTEKQKKDAVATIYIDSLWTQYCDTSNNADPACKAST